MSAPQVSPHDWPRWSVLLLSADPKQRVRLQRSLLAANVFLACVGVQVYEAWVGYMQVRDACLLSGAILFNCAFWYGLLRSGLNLRFADPALTLGQILAALSIIVWAYGVTGPVHGAVLMLLVMVWVFGVFNLSPAGARLAAVYTLVLMALMQAHLVHQQPQAYPLRLEIAHFVLVAAIVPTISWLAAQLSAMRSRLQRQKDELAQALTRIQILVSRDELTGLLNRRHMLEVLSQHRQRLGRSGHHRFCLALLDLDHFKRINDTHGHGVGDEVLRRFADVAREGLRETDVVARWGGEEFLLLLNDTQTTQACTGLERVRELLGQAQLCARVPNLTLSFSAGLTDYDGREPLEACIERADRALYAAKHAGRDRTVVHPMPTELPASAAPAAAQTTLAN